MTVPLTGIFTFTVLGIITANTFTLEGHVGGDVQIRCFHMQAEDNIKYFCKAPCITEKDVLIKSARNRNPTTNGRYSIHDEGSGVFTVTISELKKSDAGTYWCGVDRLHKHSLYDVILTVLAGKKISDSDSDVLNPTKPPVDKVNSEETDAVMYCVV